MLLVMLAGCASGPLVIGTPPQFERLSLLKPGVSTAQDVSAALGEPQGRGASQQTITPLMDTWVYTSTEMQGQNVRTRMLMVFITKTSSVYGGHMWFSSGHIMNIQR
jgi:hypothetical protein